MCLGGAIIVGMNKLKTIFAYTLGGIVLLGVVALAGSLTPTGSTSTGTMYTLNDIYNKLTTSTSTAEEGIHDISTTTTPNPDGTMRTLKEIYEKIPSILTLSSSTVDVPYGIYATTTLDTIDTDLTALKIATGTEIFGIQGTYTGPTLEWSSDQGSKTWSAAGTACATWGGRLPKLGEILNALSQQFVEGGTYGPGGFAGDTIYWSSTEVDSDFAWYGYNGSGYILNYVDSKDFEYSVRCVR